jgi:regulator of RNase E activity RraA
LDSRTEDALRVARFGDFEVTVNDCVFADDDGCIFVAAGEIDNVLPAARAIWNTERKQADKIRAGTTLRQQLKFVDYLKKRSANPAYTFRQHLREIGGAIEE